MLMFESHQRAGTVREYRVPQEPCRAGRSPRKGSPAQGGRLELLSSMWLLLLRLCGPGMEGTGALAAFAWAGGLGWGGLKRGAWGLPLFGRWTPPFPLQCSAKEIKARRGTSSGRAR